MASQENSPGKVWIYLPWVLLESRGSLIFILMNITDPAGAFISTWEWWRDTAKQDLTVSNISAPLPHPQWNLCLFAATRNVQVAGAQQNLLLLLPAPGSPGYSGMNRRIPGVFLGIFFFLHIRFPPCNIYQLLPKFSAKQRQIFFPQIYFPFPLTFMKGLKTVSVSFLALCTDHHQLFQAVLEKKKQANS